MTTNRDRLASMLQLIEKGCRPFIDEYMKQEHGTHWPRIARMPKTFTPQSDLDAYALLYVVNHNWREVFQNHLKPEMRDAASAALAGRNKFAHSTGDVDDNLTLRALTGAADLLDGMRAKPEAEAARKLAELQMQEMVRRNLERDGKLKPKPAKAPDDAKPASAEAKPSLTLQHSAPDKAPEPQQGDLLGGGKVEGLQPWRIACPPRDDVLEGRLNKDAFAANLGAAERGEGAETYSDAESFFAATHLTHGLRLTLENAAKRLTGSGGPSTVGLQTNFGGGKTHTLLSLLHLARLGDKAGSVDVLEPLRDQIAGGRMTDVKTAVFVGTDKGPDVPLDRAEGKPIRTLWGYLAWKLAGRDGLSIIESAEAAGTNPGGEAFKRVFDAAGGPSLILLDELVAYVRQLTDERYEAHLSFIQSLTEAAAQTPNALIVGSLPESDVEAGGGERALDTLRRLEKLFGRTQSVWQPAQGSETYAVIRRRLFQELDDNGVKARKRTVDAFRKLYRDHKGDFPSGTAEKDYEEKLLEAYPVHPMLFDKLSSEWGGLDKFQRTRGVLSLLARTIYASYRERRDDPLILPSSLQVNDPEVRGALIEPLDGPVWGSIVDAEVDGDRSLPVRLEVSRIRYRERNIASRASRAVFVCTAPQGDARGGLTGPELRLACVQPGEQVSIFGDALRELAETSSYLYEAEGRYWFGSKPTLNKLAHNRAQDVPADRVDARIVDLLNEDARSRGRWAAVHVAPNPPQDVEDRAITRLVILGPETPYTNGSGGGSEDAALDAVARRAGGQRHFRNALVFLAADERQLEEARKAVRRALAWDSIAKDGSLDLSRSQQDDAKARGADALRGAQQAVRKAWSHLLEPSQGEGAEVRIERTGLRPTGQKSPAEVAWDRASSDGIVAVKLGKGSLNDRLAALWPEGQDHVEVDTIRDWFFQFLYMERLRDEQALADALYDAQTDTDVSKLLFGVASQHAEDRYEGLRLNQATTLRFGAGQLLVRREVAEQQLAEHQPSPPSSTLGSAPQASSNPEPSSPQAPTEAPRPTRFTGVVSLDPLKGGSKAAMIFSDVIAELEQAKGVEVRVTLEVTASSKSGFDAETEEIVRDNASSLGFDSARFD